MDEREQRRKARNAAAFRRWRKKIGVGEADKRAQEVANEVHGVNRTSAWWDQYWRVMTKSGFLPYAGREQYRDPRNASEQGAGGAGSETGPK